MKKKILHLNLKKGYFQSIKDGEKYFEFRLCTEFWKKRIENREYDEVHFKCGYPKAGDKDNIIIKPYRGYEVQEIAHPHFGPRLVQVYAIVAINPDTGE